MKKIAIYPYEGIGNIKFGMTRKETEQSFHLTCYDEEINGEHVFVQYEDYCITYKNDRVFEITIDNIDDYKVIYNGIDLFRTKVEDIFNCLKKISEYDCDCEDEYLSSTYYFKDLGKILWRESAFHPKLLQEEWFQKLINENEENLECEKRFWFFDQIILESSVNTFKKMEKVKFHIESPEKEQSIKPPTQDQLIQIALKYKLKK
ncbi:hypothetical protein PV797_10195 [Clostridiaceae bacterium M8S5]|nr:hypothetical protein PV797_10195 [Clostridiaceae bacterium M8S5]